MKQYVLSAWEWQKKLCQSGGPGLVSKTWQFNSPKEYGKSLGTRLPKMEIKELPDKEFKIIILKLFRDLQQNIHKQFNDIRRTMQEQNEKSPRDEKKTNKNTEILELRNSMTELKY